MLPCFNYDGGPYQSPGSLPVEDPKEEEKRKGNKERKFLKCKIGNRMRKIKAYIKNPQRSIY